VDTAPPSSERFPAAWYPAENSYTVTTAPVTGAPFTGLLVMTTKMSRGGGHPPLETQMRTVTMRDRAGRTRTEEGGVEAGGRDQLGYRQIEVNDVVRHCTFRWVEPVREASRQVAQVSCLSRKLGWQDDGMTAKMTRQIPEVIDVFPGQADRIEPLGERTVAGMRALGVRQTRTSTAADGKTSGSAMEIWWSPELKEILEVQPIGDGLDLPGFEMKDFRRGEPDEALFYPPVGWRILRPGEAGP
jgi:hypothetical protein